MKKIIIEVRPAGNKVATAIQTSGYSSESAEDQFELLGIVENVKFIIQERLKKLVNVTGTK